MSLRELGALASLLVASGCGGTCPPGWQDSEPYPLTSGSYVSSGGEWVEGPPSTLPPLERFSQWTTLELDREAGIVKITWAERQGGETVTVEETWRIR